MKRPRPPLAPRDLRRAEALLTTGDVARLLRVHPKHVYRLLRRGLPGRRVGGEWRFLSEEVLRWSGAGTQGDAESVAGPSGALSPSLVAANGDLAIECLLSRLTTPGQPIIGQVQADRGEGIELLRRGDVLAAGCHGDDIPEEVEGQRMAFIQLVDRQVGLALRRGLRGVRSLRQIGRWRLASRPRTAGVRAHLDRELRQHGVDPEDVHAGAQVLPSHGDVVCAVVRGEADVGLASLAWAKRVGLESMPLCREPYGLLIPASLLGDPRIVRLCEVAQSSAFRDSIGEVPGYDARLAGVISFHSCPS